MPFSVRVKVGCPFVVLVCMGLCNKHKSPKQGLRALSFWRGMRPRSTVTQATVTGPSAAQKKSTVPSSLPTGTGGTPHSSSLLEYSYLPIATIALAFRFNYLWQNNLDVTRLCSLVIVLWIDGLGDGVAAEDERSPTAHDVFLANADYRFTMLAAQKQEGQFGAEKGVAGAKPLLCPQAD